MSIMKIIMGIIVLTAIGGIGANLLAGNGSPYANDYYNATSNATTGFYGGVYNPITQTVSSAANNTDSNTIQQASNILGFSFAFVMVGFGNVLISLVNTPKILASYVAVSVSQLGVVIGYSSLTSLITYGILVALTMFLILLAMSGIFHFPFL